MGRSKIGDIAIRIFSVIIAIFLWSVAMNQNNPTIQPTQIQGIPVRLVNIDTLAQSNLVFLGNADDFKTMLYVEGKEKPIKSLQLKPGNIVLEVDLSTGAGSFKKGKNLMRFEVKSKPADIDIPTNQPMYIEVELDEIVSKVFPVTVKITDPKKPGYARQGYTVNPEEVTISGAATYIGSVNSVQAEVDASAATSDMTKSVPLQIKDIKGNVISDKSVSCNPKNVDVTVPIKRAKEVPVDVRVTGSLPPGVTLKGELTPNPTKVSITGDESIVNAISSIETIPVNLNGITQSTTKSVRISIPAGVTVLDNIQTVNVDINVERTISKAYSVPVTILNLPDGLKAELVANTINVTLTGQESALNNLNPSSIIAVVDLSSAPAEDGEYEFTPQVTPPSGFIMTGFEPAKIRVKITRKQG